jgi:hypothetical protein
MTRGDTVAGSREVFRSFQVAHKDIAYLHFVLESYEGLAVLSTADRSCGTVTVRYPSDLAEIVDELLTALGTEIALITVQGDGKQETCSIR